MFALKFDRDRMEELLDCLDTGRPIVSERTAFDYLLLAAAAQAAAFSQGPHSLSRDRLPEMHPEQQEAVQVGFEQALVAAVGWCGSLAFQILDGEYDLPPKFAALVRVVDGELKVELYPSQ